MATGLYRQLKISMQSNLTFDKEYNVAFLNEEGVVIKTWMERLLYDAPGLPKKIEIKKQ